MKYLLDTNAVIALVNRRSARLLERIREQEPADVGLSCRAGEAPQLGFDHR